MGIPGCRGREVAVLTGSDSSLSRRRCPLPLRRPLVVTVRALPLRTSLVCPGRLEALCSQQWRKQQRVARFCAASGLPSSEGYDGGQPADEDFLVVNFYHFVPIQSPEAEVSNHLMFLQGRDIHGRIYINEQGINAQWLRGDDRFSGILVQVSPATGGHAFPRLKLRYKPSLVQLEGGASHLPLVDPTKRATPLPPSEWRRRLQGAKGEALGGGEAGSQDRKCLLLDVRNGYEWDIGHFRGAQRPNVDCFRSTTFGQSESADSDPLAGIDKENTDVLMYCTSGIRCDVYSTILREKGFQNLFTLSGGVSHYLKSEGPAEWLGNLFVFDSRLSLPPAAYNPESEDRGEEKAIPQDGNSTFASCYICRSRVAELRHRNCANLDCNFLFLCCSRCVEKMKGCCCSDCTAASRLRPALVGSQRYSKWHTYRDSEA
ncbi:unnamed protein product [Spirodela intermedia]|uniref:Rhodanese domain-containing protein n=1 Tax=Spirodela intermedia TaxID=51605 RepID=A0A7I8IXM8_SPIIN|nr:unnamed protein product [Spirodela intermedia]CAA6662724.1 unnamed protein product [Spirodela intermedia]